MTIMTLEGGSTLQRGGAGRLNLESSMKGIEARKAQLIKTIFAYIWTKLV